MDWREILVVIVALWGLSKLEFYFRLWRWRRNRRPGVATAAPDHEKARVSKAVQPVICGHPECHKSTTDYVLYADGDTWCYHCDETQE